MIETNLEIPFDIKGYLKEKVGPEKTLNTNRNLVNFFHASTRQEQVIRLYVFLDIFKTELDVFHLLRSRKQTDAILQNDYALKISEKYKFKFIKNVDEMTGVKCISYCKKIMTRIVRIFERMDTMKIKNQRKQNENVKDLLFFYGELRMVEDILHFIILFKDYTEEVYLIPYYKFHKDLASTGFFHMFSYRKLEYDDFFERFFTFRERYLSAAFDSDF